MILLNVFSILKYGAKIFLAVMGFISFDDINVKPVGNNPDFHKINFVENDLFGEQKWSDQIFYADPSYFHAENETKIRLFTSQEDYLYAESEIIREPIKSSTSIFKNIYVLDDDHIEDFEILVLNNTGNVEFEYYIQISDHEQVKGIQINKTSFTSLPISME